MPSQIRELHNLYMTLKSERPDMSFVALHFGEPDLGTPPFIIDAGVKALQGGAVFFEPNAGRLDLRDELTIDDLATLRRIVSEEGLVLIREQPLSRPAQVALGRRFGTLEALSPASG